MLVVADGITHRHIGDINCLACLKMAKEDKMWLKEIENNQE